MFIATERGNVSNEDLKLRARIINSQDQSQIKALKEVEEMKSSQIVMLCLADTFNLGLSFFLNK